MFLIFNFINILNLAPDTYNLQIITLIFVLNENKIFFFSLYRCLMYNFLLFLHLCWFTKYYLLMLWLLSTTQPFFTLDKTTKVRVFTALKTYYLLKKYVFTIQNVRVIRYFTSQKKGTSEQKWDKLSKGEGILVHFSIFSLPWYHLKIFFGIKNNFCLLKVNNYWQYVPSTPTSSQTKNKEIKSQKDKIPQTLEIK